jgi:hypothetical protein
LTLQEDFNAITGISLVISRYLVLRLHERHADHQETAGLEHPRQLLDDFDWIDDMLKNSDAEDCIKIVITDRNLMKRRKDVYIYSAVIWPAKILIHKLSIYKVGDVPPATARIQHSSTQAPLRANIFQLVVNWRPN